TDASCHRYEQLVVVFGAEPAPFIPERKMSELDVENARLEYIQSTIIPLDRVMILPRLAMVPQHSNFTCHRFVIRGHRASLAASTQIFPGIEAERSCMPHRAGLAPAMLFLREILGPVRLASVLDHDQVVPVR